MNLGTTRLRGRPRNRWQYKVREDGRIVGGEGWQEKVHNREEWKKLLRTVRNCCILHMPTEWMNVILFHSTLKVCSPFPPPTIGLLPSLAVRYRHQLYPYNTPYKYTLCSCIIFSPLLPEDEGTKILENVGTSSSKNIKLHSGRLNSSSSFRCGLYSFIFIFIHLFSIPETQPKWI